MCNIKDLVVSIIESKDMIKAHELSELIECLIESSDHPEKYEEKLYILTHGYHFDEEKMNKALKCIGKKWNTEEVCSIMKSLGIIFTGDYSDVTIYDKCYAMNMLHSDYYPMISDSSTMAKFAEKYIKDEDYPIKGGKPYAEWCLRMKLAHSIA